MARDGDTATATGSTGDVCVGCGQSPARLLELLVLEVTKPAAAKS